MITVDQLTNNIKSYILMQINNMSRTNPMISIIKPLVVRAVDKNFNKVSKVLDLIADENGNIDIEAITEEMMDNIVNMQPFIYNTSFIGDIELGGGQVKLNIPLTDKRLVLNREDLQILKEVLINKN